ncbi:hypothetical protein B7463_g12183, partial [Scytalidium lignicola]
MLFGPQRVTRVAQPSSFLSFQEPEQTATRGRPPAAFAQRWRRRTEQQVCWRCQAAASENCKRAKVYIIHTGL